jgi:Glycosyltransferase 61
LARRAVRPRSAICLPGQIDRIVDRTPDSQTTNEREIAQATSTTLSHGATIAHHIKDAILVDGCVYAKNFKYPIASKSLYKSKIQGLVRIKTAALASSYLGSRFFGHWLADDCSRHLLGQGTSSTTVCVRRPEYAHQHQYHQIFGQTWNSIDRACIDDLIVFDDYSQNKHKRQRYLALRNRVKAQFRSESEEKLVYFRRGRTGVSRLIQNEDEIVQFLMKRGFIVLDVETDSLSHIIKTLFGAKVVITIGGSHAAHCIYACPADSGLIILQPPDRFSAIYRDWAECVGFRFGYLVGAIGAAGYHFSVRDIAATIDLMVTSLARERATEIEDQTTAA